MNLFQVLVHAPREKPAQLKTPTPKHHPQSKGSYNFNNLTLNAPNALGSTVEAFHICREG